MKKMLLPILILFISEFSFAQFELKGTMGINFISAGSMQDYINYSNQGNQLGTFNSAIIFALEGGNYFSPSFVTSIEAAYQLFSYTNVSTSGKYEIVYNVIPISIIGYYVIGGDGYNFKIGGGIGPRLAFVEESLPGFGTTDEYKSIGVGLIFRFEGNTLLGDNFYANIGADLKYDLIGEPEDNGKKLTNSVYGDNVNFDTFALGVKLGVSYLIGGNN